MSCPTVPVAAPDLSAFRRDGAQLLGAALGEAALAGLIDVLSVVRPDRAGARLRGVEGLGPFLEADGPVGAVASRALGSKTRPVRAILFDKTAETNWSLAWHQDRTIAVRQRVETDGYGPWTVKEGMIHVAPPFDLLAGMATLRVHLDPVPATNAPLLVAPGSHRLGRIPEADIPGVVARCGVLACLAEPGDVWLYATPILHASEAARRPDRRRVLQVDFAARELPGALRWLGV